MTTRMTISIVTPWSGDTADLIPDYAAAIQGAEVVSVDNACPPELANTLANAGGPYVRNETNMGFAAGNNQGYAYATGDIIIFLNSDVAGDSAWLNQVATDVRDGALYGPSLAAQLVAGRHIPYLEGWCIAATRATWNRLLIHYPEYELGPYEPDDMGPWWHGPWDEEAYPGPYWEDNDLCLRALKLGIPLIQTAWPIQHKGGRTAGPIMRHAESFAANEHVFTQRVLAAISQPEQTPIWHRYMQAYHTQSDIQHHLGLLYSLARGTVVELGTRSGVSTAALLAGVEARGGHVWSIDIDDCSALYAGYPLWTCIQSDSRNAELPVQIGPVDLLLIDTEHTTEMASAELALWAPHMQPGGTILLHDPETFPGVRRAIAEFCAQTGWPVTYVLPCNGMAMIEVPRDAVVAQPGVSLEGAAWAMEVAA